MGRKSAISVGQLKEALRASGGYQTVAAQKLGTSQQCISARIKRSPALQQFVKEIENQYLDLAESKLITLIKAGNLGAICFYLKCKGRHRGYIERHEISGEDGGPLTINLKWPTNGSEDA
jgi:hypothetical protein